ncbi:Glycosyltransferase RgtA/B/C/D-like domain-containing protein [Pontibacter korlensis]
MLLYIFYCAAVVLRVTIEGTGYTSPDSEYYLEAARSLQDGDQFIIKDLYGLHTGQVNALTPFTAWPVGYPVLVVSVSWVSGLSLFWASKVVNLLFVGMGFLLLRHINQRYSYVLASVYGSFTVIEMYSYTWSECIFMFGCLCYVVLLYKVYSSGKAMTAYALLASAAFMFLIRYVGFFAGGVTLLFSLISWVEGRKSLSKHLFTAFVLNVAIVCSYVFHNHYIAGFNTDAQRLTTDMETPIEVLWMALKGLTVELFLIRNYYLSGIPDALTVATAVLQLIVTIYIIKVMRMQSKKVIYEMKKNLLSHIAVVVAVAYLLVLVFLRSISQFDPLNYRLLSPFTFLMLFAVVNYIVALPDSITGAKRTKYIIAIFFALSLFLNLPKKFLLSQLL